jgi:hypothetical protein
LGLLESQLLDGLSKDEDISEIKKEYQERLRFKQYIDFLKEGEKSDWWLKKFEQQEKGQLTDSDIAEINKVLMGRNK